MKILTDKRYRKMKLSVRDAWVKVEALQKSSDYYEKLSEERANEIAKLKDENTKLFDENRKLNADMTSVQESLRQQTELMFHVDSLRKKAVRERDEMKLQKESLEARWEARNNA